MCGSEGDGVHAVEHGECTRGDVRLWGGCGVGVRGGHGRGRMQELRGGQWQYGEDGGGGTERAAAVGRRGWADGEGGWHVSVGGQHVRVGGTYRGGGEHTDGVRGSAMEGLETCWRRWGGLRAWA